MLEFETEPLSLQLVAQSETHPYRSYWIDEGAWSYVTIVEGDRAGPIIRKPERFNSIDEAKAYCEDQENVKREVSETF